MNEETLEDMNFEKRVHNEALRRQEETRRAAMNFKRAEALAAMLEPEEEGANPET